jgi:hypothetical protein
MTGAVNVKVSVFNTDLKYKVKESQDNAAPFEISSTQSVFLHLLSPFFTEGRDVKENRREEDPDLRKK